MAPFLDMNAAMLPLIAVDQASAAAAGSSGATVKQKSQQQPAFNQLILSQPSRTRQPLEEELVLLMKASAFWDASDLLPRSCKADLLGLHKVSAELAAALFHAALQVLFFSGLQSEFTVLGQRI